jgi:uncharacterized phage protein (TIGR01671 family)
MREIKFRAVNADNELIYGLPYTDGTNETVYFKEFSNRLCWRRKKDGASCNQPYKNGTLMQFTGMKDKNGAEIYEGDIVKTESLYDDHNQKGAIAIKVVKFWCGSYHLCELNQDSGANLFGVLVVSRAEVLGNIYENPELLAEVLKND